MIPVVEKVQIVWCLHIEPRIVRQDFPILVVHGDERIGLVSVIVHHIQDDRDASFMTGIDERLQIFFRAISLVDCEVKGRVVAPTVVAIEFIHGHQFDGLNPKVFQIIQGVLNGLESPIFCEITNKKLVNEQIFLIRTLKRRVGPSKSGFPSV